MSKHRKPSWLRRFWRSLTGQDMQRGYSMRWRW